SAPMNSATRNVTVMISAVFRLPRACPGSWLWPLACECDSISEIIINGADDCYNTRFSRSVSPLLKHCYSSRNEVFKYERSSNSPVRRRAVVSRLVSQFCGRTYPAAGAKNGRGGQAGEKRHPPVV